MSEAQMLKSALWYCKEMNFSVIPVSEKKTPLIKWQQYQTEKPTIEQVQEWWSGKFKGANIGIVTGAISNLTVIDIDSNQGREALEEITPEALLTPTATTPGGGEHRYFRYQEGITNAVKFLSDCDARSEGGYIIAPPSSNGRGHYAWVKGLSIVDTEIAFLPEAYKHALNISNSIYTIDYSSEQNKTQQPITNHNRLFREGNRDHHIFHLANSLIKGGMPTEEIQQYLMFIGSRCNPPFPEKEIYTKIQSAIKRAEVSAKGLTESVRDLIKEHEGNITITNTLQWLTNHNNPQERQKIQVIMGRMVKEGLLKKTGKRAGEYRIISKEHEVQDWKNASIESVNLVLPLGMHEAIRIVPGSILMFSGVTNTGKTSFGMNIARWNCKERVTYLTSEIEQDEFKGRVANYCREHNESMDDWNVELIAKFTPGVLPDLINPDGLNIIDYLEPPAGDFTQIGPLITDIHHSLKTGIAVIAIQKKTGDEYGAGGQYIRNKAHLFCTLDQMEFPVCRLKITKCKAPKHGYRNPVGLDVEYQIDFKDGLTIIPFGKLNFSRWDR